MTKMIDYINHYMWYVISHVQTSRAIYTAWIGNYIPQFHVDVIIYTYTSEMLV